ncbi:MULTISPECIES: nitronate monooxygenase [unclassified Devosia]|uniref:NAD(P)H-dependent flavin oxidoreductase n=1 Tax=unclassified Devosia TaxID=196773 RepID=UPI000ACCD5C2|nr:MULTISPECIES: nitronate monooxygenase [unclassified Devosia]MBN9307281.1 nitronate monooxygenase [Devosia sp.]
MTDRAPSRILSLLGCRHPLVLAGMGGVARSELVAAVSEAGGFGFLGMVREPPALIRREVEAVRRRGIERFGVNIIPAATDRLLLEQQVDTILELEVPAVALFWDFDAALVRRLTDAGICVVYQVGSAAEAAAARDAGAAIVIAQGCEAGGHVRGTIPLARLLPDVVAAVDIPVLAAGGLARGDDLVTATALGAEGVVLGTALMAAEESFAHQYHKQRLLLAAASDTLLTDTFHINWPIGARVRVLSSAVAAGERGPDAPDRRVVIGEEDGRPIYLFSTDSPLRSMTGDFESMALYAGTGVGSISAIRPAADIIGALLAEADTAPIGAAAARDAANELASPVCYIGEMSGAYVGQLEAGEIAEEMTKLLGELQALLRNVAGHEVARNAPPFGPRSKALARWLAGLASAWPQSVAASQHIEAVGAGILQDHLGRLIPRLPDNDLRTGLSELRAWINDTCDQPQPQAPTPEPA